MLSSRRFLLACLFSAVTLMAFSSCGWAGVFIWATSCDTLSLNPPRTRVTFTIWDRFSIPLCEVRFRPAANQQVPGTPILECAALPGFSCESDPDSGTATFRASPCLTTGYFLRDVMSLVVASTAPCVEAGLFDETGLRRHTNLLCFSCSIFTPTLLTTWGIVKAAYR